MKTEIKLFLGIAAGLCLSGMALAQPAQVPGKGVPDFIEPGQTLAAPGWVAADAAHGPDGKVDWDRVPAPVAGEIRSRVGRLRQWSSGKPGASAGECVAYKRVIEERADSLPHGTLEDLVTHAEQIVVGRVVDVRSGFYGSSAGLLLRVVATESLTDRSGKPVPELVYYPHAEFSFGGEMVCSRGVRYPDHPVSGSRIVLFVYPDADKWSDGIIEPLDGQIFFERGRGDRSLSLPAHFGQLIPQSGEFGVDELVDQIQAELAEASR